MSGPVTIADVAREAGVSVATVSRALRGLPNVAAATRQRVEETAARLQYRPDPSAARLATGLTTTVGIIVPHLQSWYCSNAMAGAESVLAVAGYDVLIFAVDSAESRHRVLAGPLVKRTDGLIMVDVRVPDAELDAVRRSMGGEGVRVVCVGFGAAGTSKVVVDNQRVAAVAVDHLAELGHTRIALIGGEADDHLSWEVSGHRRLGYREAMAALGLEARPEYDRPGDFTVAGGQEAASKLLDLADPPTAVFAMSDEMAFGVFEAARVRGLSVPGDLSVVGVDDHPASLVVGLTTIQQDVAEHGRRAARMLVRHLAQPELTPENEEALAELVVRRSTAPPRS